MTLKEANISPGDEENLRSNENECKKKTLFESLKETQISDLLRFLLLFIFLLAIAFFLGIRYGNVNKKK